MLEVSAFITSLVMLLFVSAAASGKWRDGTSFSLFCIDTLVLALAQIVLIFQVLSLFSAVNSPAFLCAQALLCWLAFRWRKSLRLPALPFRYPSFWLLAVPLAACLAYSLYLAYYFGVTYWDALSYHLPRVLVWLSQGDLSPAAFERDARGAGLAPGGSVLHLYHMLLLKDDALLALPNILGCLLLVSGAYHLLRLWGVGRTTASLVALQVAFVPSVVQYLSSADNTYLCAAALTTAAVAYGLRYAKTQDLTDAVFFALSGALAYYVKELSAFFLLAALPAVFLAQWCGDSWKHALKSPLVLVALLAPATVLVALQWKMHASAEAYGGLRQNPLSFEGFRFVLYQTFQINLDGVPSPVYEWLYPIGRALNAALHMVLQPAPLSKPAYAFTVGCATSLSAESPHLYCDAWTGVGLIPGLAVWACFAIVIAAVPASLLLQKSKRGGSWQRILAAASLALIVVLSAIGYSAIATFQIWLKRFVIPFAVLALPAFFVQVWSWDRIPRWLLTVLAASGAAIATVTGVNTALHLQQRWLFGEPQPVYNYIMPQDHPRYYRGLYYSGSASWTYAAKWAMGLPRPARIGMIRRSVDDFLYVFRGPRFENKVAFVPPELLADRGALLASPYDYIVNVSDPGPFPPASLESTRGYVLDVNWLRANLAAWDQYASEREAAGKQP